MRVIEDLKHEDFVAISKIVPKNMKFNEMGLYANKIEKEFNLPFLDAQGCLFIVFSILTDQKVSGYEYEKKRRIEEVIQSRLTLNQQESVI